MEILKIKPSLGQGGQEYGILRQFLSLRKIWNYG